MRRASRSLKREAISFVMNARLAAGFFYVSAPINGAVERGWRRLEF
jgi:hypothetical protein